GTVSNLQAEVNNDAQIAENMGHIGGNKGKNPAPGVIEYCVVTSRISGYGIMATRDWALDNELLQEPNGGIAVGYVTSLGDLPGTITHCYWDKQAANASGTHPSGCAFVSHTFGASVYYHGASLRSLDILGKTTAEMKTVSTLSSVFNQGIHAGTWLLASGQYPQLIKKT
ncbi:MAG: hypothetical protein FWD58_05710, partial [Firmicutes bacterium]|nr:hypothetical protein [Bacillota bacterium]